MLYLQTRTILVEITKVNSTNPLYLIGDEKFDFVPQAVWKTGFKNANWNRALKYEVDPILKTMNQETNSTSRYFALPFDLYLDFNPARAVCLAFDQFNNQILNQAGFSLRMLPKILASYQKNNQVLGKLNDHQLAHHYLALTQGKVVDVNGFLVNAEFDINDATYRWNYLIKLGRANKISFSNHQQLIYEVDAKLFTDSWLESFHLIDLVNQQIYHQGYVEVENNNHLKLAIHYEEPLISLIHQQIIQTLIPVLVTNPAKFFHDYNLTRDVKYLVEFMENTKNLPYFTWRDLCAEIFASLNLNYDDLLYSLKEIKPFLLAKVTGLKELNDLSNNLHRFGNLTLDEQVKINELKVKDNVSK